MENNFDVPMVKVWIKTIDILDLNIRYRIESFILRSLESTIQPQENALLRPFQIDRLIRCFQSSNGGFQLIGL